jgi:hypothetical protein
LVESDAAASSAIDRVQEDIPHVIASNTSIYEDWQKTTAIAESLERSYNVRRRAVLLTGTARELEL